MAKQRKTVANKQLFRQTGELLYYRNLAVSKNLRGSDSSALMYPSNGIPPSLALVVCVTVSLFLMHLLGCSIGLLELCFSRRRTGTSTKIVIHSDIIQLRHIAVVRSTPSVQTVLPSASFSSRPTPTHPSSSPLSQLPPYGATPLPPLDAAVRSHTQNESTARFTSVHETSTISGRGRHSTTRLR